MINRYSKKALKVMGIIAAYSSIYEILKRFNELTTHINRNMKAANPSFYDDEEVYLHEADDFGHEIIIKIIKLRRICADHKCYISVYYEGDLVFHGNRSQIDVFKDGDWSDWFLNPNKLIRRDWVEFFRQCDRYLRLSWWKKCLAAICSLWRGSADSKIND